LQIDIIGITESRLKKDWSPIVNINLNNYEIEHTPTESSNGGALLYIKKSLAYKVRNDLKYINQENWNQYLLKY